MKKRHVLISVSVQALNGAGHVVRVEVPEKVFASMTIADLVDRYVWPVFAACKQEFEAVRATKAGK